MRIAAITALVALIGWAGPAFAQVDEPPPAPTDKAVFIPGGDLDKTWAQELATQQKEHRFISGGGGAYTVNARIVRATDAAEVHGKTLDIWIVKAGTATAITGGTMTNSTKNQRFAGDMSGTQAGGIEQPLKAGDVLYIPPGVAHSFKNVNKFQALLVRFDVK